MLYPWKGRYIAHYQQERKEEKAWKEGKKGEREEKRKGRAEEGRQEMNYYPLVVHTYSAVDGTKQDLPIFHGATQSQPQWMPRSSTFLWPCLHSLFSSPFPLPSLSFILLVLPVVKP